MEDEKYVERDSEGNFPGMGINEQAPETNLGRIEELSPWRRWMIISSVCVGMMLSVMDNSIVSTSLYTIALEFDSLADAIWTILAYSLSYLGFAVVFAQLSDFVGRQTAVLGAFTVFSAFSLGCGFAQSLNQLIALRTLKGIGGSGLYPLTIIVSLEVGTPRMLPIISGIIGAAIVVAGVLGPILGGVLSEYATWRWIFWINVPCGLLAMTAFVLAWPKRSASAHVRKSIKQFDIIGSLLLLAASVLVVLGLQEAGTGQYAWDSAVVVSALVVGCACWIALFGWEFFLTTRKSWKVAAIYPMRLFSNRIIFAAIMVTLLTGFTLFTVIFDLPLRTQIVDLKSSATAGVRLLPLLCASAVGSFLGGAASSKKNRTFPSFAIATGLILLGAGLLSTITGDMKMPSRVYGFEVLVGFGAGLTMSTVSILTSVEVKPADHAVAQGIIAQMRMLGGTIGVAAANALFQLQSHRDLRGILTKAQIAELQTSPSIITHLSESQGHAVRLAYSKSFSEAMRMCMYIAAASFVASLFTWQRHPTPVAKH